MADWISSVPTALDGLLTTLRAAPGLAGVAVDDGPNVTGSSRKEAIAVGFEDENGQMPAVEMQSELGGPVMNPAREQYTVNCLLQVVASTMSAARARVYELLAEVITTLNADQTLGGVVMSARVATHTLTQKASTKGKLASLAVAVDCDAWTRSV